MNNLKLTTSAHDMDMAREFLAGLDPHASRFTFQFFGDGAGTYAEIFHGTLDEVWPKVQALNTPERRVGVFVTVNETDFKGRQSKNIVRPRALFVDADSDEQVARCVETFTARGVTPSVGVKSGRGTHFYFFTDVPREQFREWQESLIAKVGTDPAVKDLPRVMRLPGTLHLKNPSDPRLVKLHRATCPVRRWQLSELVAKLGLSPAEAAPNQKQRDPFNLTPIERERLQKKFAHLGIRSLSESLETNVEEIRSAVSAIPPSAISTETEWLRLARGLAHEAAIYKKQSQQLWEILDTASRSANGYDEAENRSRWLRYIGEAFNCENPITIATVFDLAKRHGWHGWSPPIVVASSTAGLKVSFSNISHRQWLYGVDLVRGDYTVIGSPGGVGKSSLALGMAVSIATGKVLLGEKIWAGRDLTSLYINAEDSGMEMQRRVWAFCLKHGITEQDLDRLYLAGTDDARVQGLSFLRTMDKNSSVLNEAAFNRLEELLTSLRPDLVVLDPLVALCGGGNINDNAAMSSVVRELKRVAIKFDCAILIIHHNRKGGEPGSAEAISGAAAIVNLARHAIMPVTMTEKEANDLSVLQSERFRYFKLVDAKSNLAPRSTDSPWYQLQSVELPNPAPPIFPHGDNVQAITRVNLPLLNNASAAADDQKIQQAILDLVGRGKMIDGQSYPYSPSTAGAENERAILDDAKAAVAIATAPRQWLPNDLKGVVKGAIRKMKTDGWLVEDDMKNLTPEPGRFRKARGLAVDWARTPWPNANINSGTAASDTTALVQADEHGGQLVNEVVND